MTSRSEATFNVGADFSDVFSGLRRVDSRVRDTARRLNGLGGGLPGVAAGVAGRGIGGARRGLGGAARIGLGGAGIGAGFVIVERLLERLFEKFEGTDILETFTSALDAIFDVLAPLAGILIQVLAEPLKALTPLLSELALVFAPIIRIFGTSLVTALTILLPLLIPVVRAFGSIAEAIEDFVFRVVRQVNRLPGINIDLAPIRAATIENAQRQIAAAAQPDAATVATVAPTVAVVINLDGETVRRITRRANISNSETGG